MVHSIHYNSLITLKCLLLKLEIDGKHHICMAERIFYYCVLCQQLFSILKTYESCNCKPKVHFQHKVKDYDVTFPALFHKANDK